MVKTKRGLIAALIAVIWAVTAVLFLIPNVSATAFPGTFDISGGTIGTDWTYENGVLTVKSPKAMTIRNADPNTPIKDTIVVQQNISANITLAGVNIDVSGTRNACAFKIEDNSTGNVTITLADSSENFLKSGDYCAGLQKNGTVGSLEIKGSGSLEAFGGYLGAGIGGGNNGSGTNITISSGTVTANGGYDAAGIGGGSSSSSLRSSGSGSNITISGGTVTAKGRYCGSGIGGGSEGSGSNITISGGTVTAAGGTDSNWGGAGIGGGWKGDGSDIIISGGSVKAIAGSNANAIGGGNGKGAVIPTNGSGDKVYPAVIPNPDDKDVYIDGKLYSPKNHKAADSSDTKLYAYLTGKNRNVRVGNDEIEYLFSGSSLDALAADFTVTGDNPVYGTDYTYPTTTGVLTILSDKKVTISGTTATTTDNIVVAKNISADITLDGVNIDVSTTNLACAFKIEDNSTGDITITLADGSTNTLKSGYGCAGLQKNGSGFDIGKLTVSGTGKLTANGGDYAAGIGGGIYTSSANITISGGTVTANGGDYAAGIGGGIYTSSANITISGGTVTANGGDYAAGIGGGYNDAGDNITISGGSVKATAGTDANAIGGGYGYGAVTPTLADKSTPVYLLEIANPDGKAITINGSDFTPVFHGDEKKIYAYLPAKTVADPCIVTVGENISKYYYNTANNKWYGMTDIPDADDTVFTYNGKEQTYTIPESSYYIVTGNKQKNAGAHTVTVALNENYSWSDGTTEDKEYTFTIAKAEPTITVTAKPTSDIAGKTITVTASAINPNNTALDDIPEIVLTYKVGDGAETPFTGSFVIPEETAIGTIITVKAKTAEDGNYKSGEAETRVNVSDCGHTDVQTEWSSDSTGHWHICNYCSENVDFAAHTYGEWKITVPATEASDGKKEHSCTVCGYTEEEAVKFEKAAAAKAAEEAEKALDELTAGNDTTAEDIINSITGAIDDDVIAEVTEIKKVPATENSEGSVTVVITITDSDGNTETVEKTFVIGKLPKTADDDNDKPVYYPVSISGNVTADRTSAKAGETVNVSTAFGYDIIVTANGRQIARITEKGSFVMPNGSVYITVVQNDTLAVMSNAWNHSYVYSYDSDMNRIKISSDSKRGTVTIKLGSEYAGREFIIYKGRNSTKVKITEGVLDENGTYSFKADDGRNYTLVIK